MIDALGLQRATRVKHQQPVKPIKSIESAANKICLECPFPFSKCSGSANCVRLKRLSHPAPEKNPCDTCSTRAACQRNNWTCWQKREFDRL